MTEVDERTIEFLRRAPALSILDDEGPLDRRSFADRLDVSRSTAYRTTTTLRDRGAVTGDGSEYRTTPFGTAIGRAAQRFRQSVSGADTLRPVLERIDHPELLDNVHHFAEARITTPSEEHPYRVVDRIVELFERGDHLRWLVTGRLVPATLQDYPLLDGLEGTVEVVVDAERDGRDETVLTDLGSDPDTTDSCSIVAGDPPFTVGIVEPDDRVAVVGFDDQFGLPGVVAETDDPAAIAWAKDCFERHWQQSHHLTHRSKGVSQSPLRVTDRT